jgi:hypothetical protein
VGRKAGVELARAGEIPIWLAAEVCEESFRTSVARAISPYTSLSPDELLRAAEAAGRAVVFIIDDLARPSDAVRQALLDGAEAVRLRRSTWGLLLTVQNADAAASIPDTLDIELLTPTDPERQALLNAYGAPQIIDRCDAFVSPLELSLAATYSGTLSPGASARSCWICTSTGSWTETTGCAAACGRSQAAPATASSDTRPEASKRCTHMNGGATIPL